MRQVSYTALRKELASYIDETCASRAPLLVTRQSGASVVMLAQDEYDALMETVHLLRSPANAKRLDDIGPNSWRQRVHPTPFVRPCKAGARDGSGASTGLFTACSLRGMSNASRLHNVATITHSTRARSHQANRKCA